MNIDGNDLITKIFGALQEEGVEPEMMMSMSLELEGTIPLCLDEENETIITRRVKVKGTLESCADGYLRLDTFRMAYKDFKNDEEKPFRKHSRSVEVNKNDK